MRAESHAAEVAVTLELAEAGGGIGVLDVVPADADPVVEALECELRVLAGLDFDDSEAAVRAGGEQIEHATVAAGKGRDLGVNRMVAEGGVETGEVAAEFSFEPALGLEAVEEVAFVAGGGAAGAELGDELAESFGVFFGERGFAWAGARR